VRVLWDDERSFYRMRRIEGFSGRGGMRVLWDRNVLGY
jgi:hypothetical protein